MARVVVDPVTRIEGHLRIEAVVEDGRITDAYSAGTMVRGFDVPDWSVRRTALPARFTNAAYGDRSAPTVCPSTATMRSPFLTPRPGAARGDAPRSIQPSPSRILPTCQERVRGR